MPPKLQLLSYNGFIVAQSPNPFESIRLSVRKLTRRAAQWLDNLSHSRITPDMVTITALVAHVPIAVLIGTGYYTIAAVLLVIFGLFDSIDGELARLQKKASSGGMLLDASTDRMKEVLLFCGIAYAFVQMGQPYWAVWAVAACGGSILVSYVKAKGETALTGQHMSANEINRVFQDGLMRYEIRMAVLVACLLLKRLDVAVVIIAVLGWLTAFQRLVLIKRKL